MIARKTNLHWFEFHIDLMNFDIFINDVWIPKFILFYRGYEIKKIIFNRYPELTVIKKQKTDDRI